MNRERRISIPTRRKTNPSFSVSIRHPRDRGDFVSHTMTARHSIFLFATLLFVQMAVITMTLLWGNAFLAAFVALLSLAAGAFFVTTAYSVLFGAPYVPTDKRRVQEMIALSGIRPGEKLVDLGSGDGRIVVAAAKAGAVAEGWEVNPYLWLISVWNIWRHGVRGRARVHLGTYWTQPFRDADVITLFLITTQMRPMERKLRAELKSGSRVVSYIFSFPGWAHEEKRSGVYLYRQP